MMYGAGFCSPTPYYRPLMGISIQVDIITVFICIGMSENFVMDTYVNSKMDSTIKTYIIYINIAS